ncbi:MAG: hypothetical protein AAGK14_12175 [Verrucomicrobiota bacterium]
MSPEYLPTWILLGGLGLVVAASLLAETPRLRPGKNSIGYWPLLLIVLMGIVGTAGPWQNVKMTPIAYEVMAIGLFFLLRHYGGARAENASWLWLIGSQLAFVLMLLLNRGILDGTAFSWLLLLAFFLVLPVWPFSFWWGETISQSPLPVAVLLPIASLTLPGFLLGLAHLHPAEGFFAPGGWLWLPMLISLFLAALALGRQSDLKLALAFGVWAWVLALSLRPVLEAPDLLARTAPASPPEKGDEFFTHVLPYFKNEVVNPAVSLSLLLIVAAFALLIGHLQRGTGTTFVEDLQPLAKNPGLARLRRCWTFASWLLAALPVTFLWQALLGGDPGRSDFASVTVPLAAALVLLAGSLFHLRGRLFDGDGHTTGTKEATELPVGLYGLVLVLLGAAAMLPFLLQK